MRSAVGQGRFGASQSDDPDVLCPFRSPSRSRSTCHEIHSSACCVVHSSRSTVPPRANAQTKAATPPPPSITSSSGAQIKARRNIPPPPPISSIRTLRRKRTTSLAQINAMHTPGRDIAGRTDLAGKPVSFYPVSKGVDVSQQGARNQAQSVSPSGSPERSILIRPSIKSEMTRACGPTCSAGRAGFTAGNRLESLVPRHSGPSGLEFDRIEDKVLAVPVDLDDITFLDLVARAARSRAGWPVAAE